jgi:hypothetical protein
MFMARLVGVGDAMDESRCAFWVWCLLSRFDGDDVPILLCFFVMACTLRRSGGLGLLIVFRGVDAVPFTVGTEYGFVSLVPPYLFY